MRAADFIRAGIREFERHALNKPCCYSERACGLRTDQKEDGLNGVDSGEISDSAGDFEQTVVSAGGKPQLLDRYSED